ncbi:hypothetical protein [Streptomyces sp. NPDC088725]|uniref:hypothetical protein n=1 Tax=Streptomyces sp. NPDC088725 TaxID=3365873 RepID=UPI0038157C53
MPGSQGSHDSGDSNASSFHSVRIDDGRRSTSVRSSSSPVPDSAPQLFEGAGTGVYDANAREFYAVNGNAVARWDQRAVQWVSENRTRIARALVDATPSLIQGASNFMTGRAATITRSVGIAAQGIVGGQELYDQYQQYQAGGHVDPYQVATSAARLASAGMNTYGAAANQSAPGTTMVDGAGTWVAGGATAADAVHHAHTDPGRAAEDPGYEMYGMHNNPQLGYQPGQYPPGYEPASEPQSSTSSLQPQSPLGTPAGAYSPPAGNTAPQRESAAGPSSGHVSQRRHTSNKEGKKKAKR